MCFLLSLVFSWGFGLQIPQGLSPAEQQQVLEVVGLGSNSKFLSNAYPLGGYQGLEVSLGLDSLATGDLAQLGNGTDRKDSTLIPTLVVGKGLYNDMDLFVQLSPPSKNVEVAKFGASLRWGFYQALFLPINFSVVINADMATIKEQLSTRNLGADLVMGMALSQFSFFLGGGFVNSSGDFSGGLNGLTASTKTEKQTVESSHFMFGATYNFEPFFVGLALNRYVDSVYSLKMGFLF